jgi:hypothetical protein
VRGGAPQHRPRAQSTGATGRTNGKGARAAC